MLSPESLKNYNEWVNLAAKKKEKEKEKEL